MTESITRVGNGVYRVDCDGRTEIVYVAGPPDNRWAFWNGHVFRAGQDAASNDPHREARASHARQSIEAPMPARVLKVLVESGASVRKGDPIVVLDTLPKQTCHFAGVRGDDQRDIVGGLKTRCVFRARV